MDSEFWKKRGSNPSESTKRNSDYPGPTSAPLHTHQLMTHDNRAHHHESPLSVLSEAAAAILETKRGSFVSGHSSASNIVLNSLNPSPASSLTSSSGVISNNQILPTGDFPSSHPINRRQEDNSPSVKMKRIKDRRGLSSSFRIKRTMSPSSFLMDDGSSGDPSSPSEKSFSPSLRESPFRSLPCPMDTSPVPSIPPHLNLNKRDRSCSSLTYRGSPYELSLLHKEHLQSTRRNSDPSDRAVIAAIMAHRQAATEMYTPPDDQPIDMSLKSRNSSGSESFSRSERSDSGSDVPLGSQMRPSVITCAPSMMHSKHAVSPTCSQARASVSHSPHGSNGFIKPEEHRRSTGVYDLARSYLVYEDPPPQQQRNKSTMDAQISERASKLQILSGVAENVDPVIDEHFRRSLGKDYSELLNKNSQRSSSSTTTSISSTVSDVDDHFAKALGATTWMKLKKGDNHGNQISSLNTSKQEDGHDDIMDNDGSKTEQNNGSSNGVEQMDHSEPLDDDRSEKCLSASPAVGPVALPSSSPVPESSSSKLDEEKD